MSESESVSFSIRMPRALRDELDQAAQVEGVSTAKQIIRLLEAGLRGGATSDPALAPIARHISEAERLTGADWREDVRTFGAAKALIERWLESERPRPENYDEIAARSEKSKDARNQLIGTLSALEAAGVIRRTSKSLDQLLSSGQPNALIGLLGRYQEASTPVGNQKLIFALFFHGYELAVDSEADAVSWSLTDENGEPLDDDSKLGLKALLAMVIPFFERANKTREDYLNAWVPDDEALAAGKALVEKPTRPE